MRNRHSLWLAEEVKINVKLKNKVYKAASIGDSPEYWEVFKIT